MDNLRVMAATIENMDRVPERNTEYLSDECEDDDDCAGPAL